MNTSSVNGFEVGVLITVAPNTGNLVLHCSDCQESWVVSIRLAASPFWEVFVGSALLIAVSHYQEEHARIAGGTE